MSNLNNRELNYVYWRSKCDDLKRLNAHLVRENQRLKKKLRKQYINPNI